MKDKSEVVFVPDRYSTSYAKSPTAPVHPRLWNCGILQDPYLHPSPPTFLCFYIFLHLLPFILENQNDLLHILWENIPWATSARGDIWQCLGTFWLSQRRIWVGSGCYWHVVGGAMLLNILQCTGQPWTSEDNPASNVSHVEAEKPYIHSFVSHSSFPLLLPSTSLYPFFHFIFFFPTLFLPFFSNPHLFNFLPLLMTDKVKLCFCSLNKVYV